MNHVQRMAHLQSSSRQYKKAHRRVKAAAPPASFRMKLQLDHRTTITITKESSLAFWRKRYPNLSMIQ